MVSACARRKQIAYVRKRGISLRRSCALLQVARSTIGYESTLVKRDAPVLAVMRELAAPSTLDLAIAESKYSSSGEGTR